VRLGIDVDNTLMDYSAAIQLAASEILGLELPRSHKKDDSVKAIRDSLGNDAWTELQGHLYAEYSLLAKPFQNAISSIREARALGFDVHLVSHKSRTPASSRQVDLIIWAKTMLESNGIVDALEGPGNGGWTNIHFCETFQAKVEKVFELKCGIFVDDLASVLENLSEEVQGLHIFCDSKHPQIHGSRCVRDWQEVIKFLRLVR
jgi:hypothetical protein